MSEILVRFLVGGAVVSAFAIIGDLLKPKSFAGLFGAAPSVALASLGLTIATEGACYAATESRSMIAGAIAFMAFASCVSWVMMRYKVSALLVTICSIPLWFGIAFGLSIEKQKKEEKGLRGTRRGSEAATVDAAGSVIGSVGLVAFALIVWQFAPRYSTFMVLTGATVAWLMVSVLIWQLRKRV